MRRPGHARAISTSGAFGKDPSKDALGSGAAGAERPLSQGDSDEAVTPPRGSPAVSRTMRAPVANKAIRQAQLGASFDGSDSDTEGSPVPATDADSVDAMLARGTHSDTERAELQALAARLRSGDAAERDAATRQLHAVRALGLHGAARQGPHARGLAATGRSASDPRLVRGDSAPGGGAARFVRAGTMRVSLPAAAAPASPALARRPLSRRASLWAKLTGGAPVRDSVPGPGAALEPLPWDATWDTPCDAMAPNEWRDPHPATAAHALLHVDTQKLCLSLAGPCGMAPDFGALTLEDIESYRYLYECVFVSRPHVLYLGRGPRGPVVCAVETATSKRDERARYRVLTLDKNGYHKSVIAVSGSTRERLKQLKRAAGALEGVQLRKPERQPQLSTQMLIFEKKRIVHHSKVGVIYVKAGQRDENAVYSNEHGSPQFVAFLRLLGDLVPLRGHTGFRAGLDTKEDLTGHTSLYTVAEYGWDGVWADTGAGAARNSDGSRLRLEMMFHVAPLLPYDPINAQQLHRKRHIGNDIVVLFFCEGAQPFNPEVMTSNYNHVYVLVRPVPDDPSGRRAPTHYAVSHASVRGVKPFRPYLPADALVPADKLRPWLLTKLLNAERAALYSAEFHGKLTRTAAVVLGSWLDEFP